MEQRFEKLYLQFRVHYYRRMVEVAGVRDGSLSAMEGLCVEVIYLLDGPTLSQFAAFLKISLSNANYKVNNLVKKGYLVKEASSKDRREQRLQVTDKFLAYYGLNDAANARLMRRIRETFTEDEVRQLEITFDKLVGLMMEEDET